MAIDSEISEQSRREMVARVAQEGTLGQAAAGAGEAAAVDYSEAAEAAIAADPVDLGAGSSAALTGQIGEELGRATGYSEAQRAIFDRYRQQGLAAGHGYYDTGEARIGARNYELDAYRNALEEAAAAAASGGGYGGYDAWWNDPALTTEASADHRVQLGGTETGALGVDAISAVMSESVPGGRYTPGASDPWSSSASAQFSPEAARAGAAQGRPLAISPAEYGGINSRLESAARNPSTFVHHIMFRDTDPTRRRIMQAAIDPGAPGGGLAGQLYRSGMPQEEAQRVLTSALVRAGMSPADASRLSSDITRGVMGPLYASAGRATPWTDAPPPSQSSFPNTRPPSQSSFPDTAPPSQSSHPNSPPPGVS